MNHQKWMVIAVSAFSQLAFSTASPADNFVTFDNNPLGTTDEPLILRTYFPDPGLGPEVLPNHDIGHRARKYRPGRGDVAGFDDPIRGITSAIGVNFGPSLSYCWDTTECRLLYAWQGGFLDMYNYWGDPQSGNRRSFGYIPTLTGPLIYLAQGSHPLGILEEYADDNKPEFKAVRMIDGIPAFEYQLGSAHVQVRIVPGAEPMTFEKHYKITGVDAVGYQETGYKIEGGPRRSTETEFTVTIQGKPVMGADYMEEEVQYSTDEPNIDWGRGLYNEFGCSACHSLDGSRGHGPTFMGLNGSTRNIIGMDAPITVDDDYLRESILNPTAKTTEGFPPGYMPTYPISDDQVESLVLFLKTLNFE